MKALVFQKTKHEKKGDGYYYWTACFRGKIHVDFVDEAHSENTYLCEVGRVYTCPGKIYHAHQGRCKGVAEKISEQAAKLL